MSGNPAPVQDRDTGIIWLLFCRNRMDGDEPEISAGIALRTVWGNLQRRRRGDLERAARDHRGGEAAGLVVVHQRSRARHPVAQRPAADRLRPPGHGVLRRARDPDYSHVIYSDDHGASWYIGGSADRGTNESTAVETADGWLYLNSRNQSPRSPGGASFHRQISWSGDGGVSFSPRVADAALPEPICQASLCRYSLAGEGGGRNRILFSNPANATRGQRHQLTVRLSYDECRSWPVRSPPGQGRQLLQRRHCLRPLRPGMAHRRPGSPVTGRTRRIGRITSTIIRRR